MARPRTSDGLKPPMATRLRIARSSGLRYHRLFAELFPQDFNQTSPLIALMAGRKHRTIEQYQRFCGRLWYAVSRDYGLRRKYAPGNKKTGWYADVG
jgi:hypothetical protein